MLGKPRPRRVAIFHFRRLETRLLVSFLALAGIPALVLTLLAADRLSRALDRLHNPGVERAFSRSATLSAELVDRLRFEAMQLLDDLPPAPPPEGGADRVAAQLREAQYGFVAWESDGATRIVDARPESAREGGPTPEDWKALAAGTDPELAVGGTLRFFAPATGPGPARAIGLTVSADLAHAVRFAADDHARYLQLEIFSAVQKRLVWFWSGAVFLVAAGAAFLVSRLTAHHISRPVAVLARAADRVAGGDLSTRAEVDAHGEIGGLVSSFNRMTDQLEKSRDELVRVERIAAWRDVARRIAHEIRNPLTPVKLAIHRLRSRLPDDEVAQECLRSIDDEVDSLNRISESFSEFAKMPEARFGPADLAQTARSVVSLYSGTVPGVTVEYEGPDSLGIVADADQLRRAVTNLVKNATEALPGGGTIRVRVSAEPGRVVLEVADDGPGVPDEIRGTLFRPGVSARPGGSGLGLSMVHRIASDHEGALRLKDSESGACFALEIPLDLTESA